jgi:hypothetical protein
VVSSNSGPAGAIASCFAEFQTLVADTLRELSMILHNPPLPLSSPMSARVQTSFVENETLFKPLRAGVQQAQRGCLLCPKIPNKKNPSHNLRRHCCRKTVVQAKRRDFATKVEVISRHLMKLHAKDTWRNIRKRAVGTSVYHRCP